MGEQSMAKMRFGVFVPQGWRMDLAEIADPVAKFEAMTRVAKAADAGPWTGIWVYDHFHTVPEPTLETTFECWTITATLARDTSRVRLGQMVGCNGFRHPSLYAKIASTVDVASHGRLDAGFGAGWYEHEWRAYGFGFPETRERMRMFREACEIVKRMWTEDRPVFHGEHYQIDGPINEPKGAQQPHIPLWIGGGGEQVTLRLVARWGDACNVGGGNPEVVRQKLEVLKRHCEAVGRDYDTITKSTSMNAYVTLLSDDPARVEKLTAPHGAPRTFVVLEPEAIRERVSQLQEAGADYLIVYLPGLAYDLEPMKRFEEEVVAHFA
jgi:F420-dependent oxidoreductase-like protein